MNTKERTLVMISIQGKGVSSGVGVGPLYFYHRTKTEIPRYTVTDPDAEWHRFKGAQTAAIEQLGELAEKARAEAGDEAAMLFETHQMMAEDLDYEDAISDHINNEKMNAEAAISDTAVQFAAMFESMDDSYMQARAADVRDVSDRILGILSGAVQGGIASDVPVLLAADDLAPSETVQLDKSKILGFITAGGSGSSHTAILARTMGIPAIVGVGDALKPEYEGRSCIIDGATGNVVIDPDDMTRDYLLKKREQQLRLQRLLETLKGQPNVTKDGKSIRIYCNIGSPDDVHAVQVNDGGGIGLFRSEFLFMDSAELPSEEEQFNAYRKVASALKGAPVIIRTLDVGGDKEIPYLHMVKEDNPFMGFRAVRYCLANPDQYKVQLRALLRASAFGDVKIMIPLVTCVEEVVAVKELVEQCKAELTEEGRKFNENIEVGIMVETPAASLLADRLAEVADFFSIGTNDLIGYTMCADRGNDTISNLYQVYYPAVLRSLKNIIESGVKAGIMVGMCGEAAADPLLEPLLISWGLEEFSMSAPSILRARKTISQWTKAECDELAEKALACNTAAEVKALLESAAR